MNTYRYTPEKIVEEKLIFSIPLYQRLFSWGEEQVKGLLYDLKIILIQTLTMELHIIWGCCHVLSLTITMI